VTQPSIILFDVDGTLIDSYRLYLESYRRALAPVLGAPPSDDEIIARAPSSERRFLEEWIGAERTASCHAEMCRHYAELHSTLGEGTYEGVREMLAALRSASLRLGIVTGKGRYAWGVAEWALDLGAFEVVVTDEDVAAPKPDPGGILAALRAMGGGPAEAVYVGDSVTDIQAARSASVRAAAALWPKTDPEDRERFLAAIAPLDPDWLLERPSDLTRALAGWC
jgi:HAD superfamily hydrolase (TIGR01549 family)